jgi:hypothetical protein
MSVGDQILRAHAIITSLRTNLPNQYEVEEAWVKEFNDALGKVEAAVGMDLADVKVAQGTLYRLVASSNYLTDEVHYREGRWCRRETLLHKIDSARLPKIGLKTSAACESRAAAAEAAR